MMGTSILPVRWTRKGEAVQRAHAQDGVDVGIVVFLDPVGELAVACVGKIADCRR